MAKKISETEHASKITIWEQLGKWLVQPAESVLEPENRRSARLLSIFLLCIILLMLSFRIIAQVSDPAYVQDPTDLIGYFFLFTAYVLSRTKHFRIGAWLMIAPIPMIILASISGRADQSPHATLNYLLIALLLASIFFKVTGTIAILVINTCVFIFLPKIAPQIFPNFTSVISPMLANLVAGVLIIIFMVHRNRIEEDRQSELKKEIEERKKTEEALRESEERFREIFNNANDAIYLWEVNADGRVEKNLAVNDVACNMLGYSKAEFSQMTPVDLNPPGSESLVGDVIKKLKEMGHVRAEMVHVTKSGEQIPVEISIHRFTLREKLVYLSVARDITERQKGERKIQALNESLERRVEERTAELAAANKEIESFSYSVSHDLRAPLRTIMGFSQILDDEYGSDLPQEAIAYFDKIQTAVDKMDMLIEDILKLSRLGRLELSKEEIDIPVLAKNIMKQFEEQEGNREIDFQISSCPTIHADRALVEILLTNLFSNAIKFSQGREKREIKLGCYSESGSEVFFVKDNGVGFDEKYGDKLFEIFQRLHSESEFKGTGIGLAIARQVVQRHGGRIWAEAEPDKGATIFFTLSPK